MAHRIGGMPNFAVVLCTGLLVAVGCNAKDSDPTSKRISNAAEAYCDKLAQCFPGPPEDLEMELAGCVPDIENDLHPSAARDEACVSADLELYECLAGATCDTLVQSGTECSGQIEQSQAECVGQ